MITLSIIQETITYSCSRCGSENIVRNGYNKCGSAQYSCKDCGAHRVLKPKQKHSPRIREQILKAYRERMSLRGVERVFKICRQTVMKWLQDYVQTLPHLFETLLPARQDDVLELDEAWSFVAKKTEKRWLWTAICRRTRQIVAFVTLYSDFWKAYSKVFPFQTRLLSSTRHSLVYH